MMCFKRINNSKSIEFDGFKCTEFRIIENKDKTGA